jgi:hypothetical protein
MNSLLRGVIAITALVVLVPQLPIATAQSDSGPSTCVATVPAGWGEFKGASEFGLAFQDSSGTLRFVRNTICQVSGTQVVPVVSLEVHRK